MVPIFVDCDNRYLQNDGCWSKISLILFNKDFTFDSESLLLYFKSLSFSEMTSTREDSASHCAFVREIPFLPGIISPFLS